MYNTMFSHLGQNAVSALIRGTTQTPVGQLDYYNNSYFSTYVCSTNIIPPISICYILPRIYQFAKDLLVCINTIEIRRKALFMHCISAIKPYKLTSILIWLGNCASVDSLTYVKSAVPEQWNFQAVVSYWPLLPCFQVFTHNIQKDRHKSMQLSVSGHLSCVSIYFGLIHGSIGVASNRAVVIACLQWCPQATMKAFHLCKHQEPDVCSWHYR